MAETKKIEAGDVVCEICDQPYDGEGFYHPACRNAFADAHIGINGPCVPRGRVCMWKLGDAVPCDGSKHRPEVANGR